MSAKTHVIMIDNYDSFTFNLVDFFKKSDCNVLVYRNTVPIDFIIKKLDTITTPKCVILSPGPGNPTKAGICLELIKFLYNKVPILGICLGHQSIGQAFGADIDFDDFPCHGKSSSIHCKEHALFFGLPQSITVGRYHSLFIKNLPSSLQAIAFYHSMIMAIAHKEFPVYGIQFHPESILSPHGEMILENFIKIVNSSSKEKFHEK